MVDINTPGDRLVRISVHGEAVVPPMFVPTLMDLWIKAMPEGGVLSFTIDGREE